jgi:hypothetical protein
MYVNDMNHISIRDLQKISGKAISELAGTTPVKSGDRTIALLVPLRRANVDRLRTTLAKAEKLAKGRNPRADDAALARFGDVDPTDWSVKAVRKLQAQHKRSIQKRKTAK